MSRTALYRHFSSDGSLLYVGISLNAVQRTMQHRQNAIWFDRIARIEVEWHDTRVSALAAEAIAIARERPECNRHRPKPPSAHELLLDFNIRACIEAADFAEANLDVKEIARRLCAEAGYDYDWLMAAL